MIDICHFLKSEADLNNIWNSILISQKDILLFRTKKHPLMTSHHYTFFIATITPYINAIYGANAEILHVRLGRVYNYTGLNFEAVTRVNKSARILSKHVRPSQFFSPFETNPTSE